MADSWATDAHKTLNVTYDCGIAIVRDPAAVRAAMGVHASYLPGAPGPGNAYEKVPELSRRARGVPVWAALRALGSSHGTLPVTARSPPLARSPASRWGSQCC